MDILQIFGERLIKYFSQRLSVESSKVNSTIYHK